MKFPLSLFAAAVLAGASVTPASAQVFRPETVGGAVLGGLAGAVIGHNDGRHGWEGAAYGAAAGALIGTAVGHARDADGYRRTHPRRPVYVRPGWSTSPRWHVGVGYHHRSYPRHGWSSSRYHRPYRHAGYGSRLWVGPSWGWGSGWDRGYGWDRPVYRTGYAPRAALLGGIAGAIIGHNDGRHGWEGAAYGVGAGYLLGRWADARANQVEPAVPVYSAPVGSSAQSAAPSQVTIINNYYAAPAATPMASANRIFGR